MVFQIDLKKIEGIPGSKLACAISTQHFQIYDSMRIVCGVINKKNKELTIIPTLEIEINYYSYDYLIERSSIFMRVTNKNNNGITNMESTFFSNENAKTMWNICMTLLNEDHSTCTAKLVDSCFQVERASALSLESIIKLQNEIFKQKLSSRFPRLLKCLEKIIKSSNIELSKQLMNFSRNHVYFDADVSCSTVSIKTEDMVNKPACAIVFGPNSPCDNALVESRNIIREGAIFNSPYEHVLIACGNILKKEQGKFFISPELEIQIRHSKDLAATVSWDWFFSNNPRVLPTNLFSNESAEKLWDFIGDISRSKNNCPLSVKLDNTSFSDYNKNYNVNILSLKSIIKLREIIGNMLQLTDCVSSKPLLSELLKKLEMIIEPSGIEMRPM